MHKNWPRQEDKNMNAPNARHVHSQRGTPIFPWPTVSSRTRQLTRPKLVAALLLCVPFSAHALDVLLTNDDGWNAPGISAMRAALCAAGHKVTLVGPATNQSGRGGSMNAGVLRPASFMSLTRQSSDSCGARYSLAAPTGAGSYGGTPVDAVTTGLDVLFAKRPPDLVVSGLNLGQNMGMTITNASGTLGAAIQAAARGIPAVAGSVSMLFEEESNGFASTLASFEPASAFVVRLIASLTNLDKKVMLPSGVRLLNVNFPARRDATRGVALTRLAERADLETKMFDVNAGFAAYLPADAASPACATLTDGARCYIGVGITQPQATASSGPMSDTQAVAHGLISITPLDADMTAPTTRAQMKGLERLTKLTP